MNTYTQLAETHPPRIAPALIFLNTCCAARALAKLNLLIFSLAALAGVIEPCKNMDRLLARLRRAQAELNLLSRLLGAQGPCGDVDAEQRLISRSLGTATTALKPAEHLVRALGSYIGAAPHGALDGAMEVLLDVREAVLTLRSSSEQHAPTGHPRLN